MPTYLDRSTGNIVNSDMPPPNSTSDPSTIQGRVNDLAKAGKDNVNGVPLNSIQTQPQGVQTPKTDTPTSTIQKPVETPYAMAPVETPKPVTTAPNASSNQIAMADKPTASMDDASKISTQASAIKDQVSSITQMQKDLTAKNKASADKKTADASKNKIEAQTNDLLSSGLDYIAKMAKGDDTEAKAQFNSWLQGFSKAAAGEQAAFMMNLKSQPGYVEGSGEGTAAMLMLARQSETSLADIVSKMSIDNLHQIGEWNKLGIEKSIEVKNLINTQETHDASMLANDIATLKSVGAYDQISSLLNQKYPGVHIDAAAIRASDPARTSALGYQLDSVDRLVRQGDADGAKKLAQSIYGDYWKELGYASPEQAMAFASQLDFSQEAFKVRNDYINSVTTSMRNDAMKGDDALGKKDVETYFKANGVDPASVGGGLTLDQVNEMKKYFNPSAAPITSLTGEDKKQLGVDWEWYQQKKGASGANLVNTIFTNFAQLNPNLATDPQEKSLTMAWIQKSVLNQSIVPDANSPGGFKIANDTAGLPPWQDPETSHYFTTWPVVDFKQDGTYDVVAPGDIPYSFLNGSNYGAYSAAEDQRLDKAYNNFLHSSDYTKGSTRDQWFYATKGGTVPFKQENVKNGTSSVPTDDVTLQGIYQKSNLDQPLSASDVSSLKASGALEKIASSGIDGATFDSNARMNKNGGLVQIGNKVAKVIPSTVTILGQPFNAALFLIDGKYYSRINGKWISVKDVKNLNLGDQKTYTIISDPTV